jgi:hypothetical protein
MSLRNWRRWTAALEKADTALAAGAPFLSVAEPAFLFELLTLRALGVAIRDRDSFDAAGPRVEFIAVRKEGGVGGDQLRRAAQELVMHIQSGKQ